MILVHLFVYFAHVNFSIFSLASSSWCRPANSRQSQDIRLKDCLESGYFPDETYKDRDQGITLLKMT